MQEIGKRLKQLRKNMHLTQIQMADILGVKQASITKYEQGLAAPGVEILRRYADYFHVSMDYIFARTDDENDSKRLAADQETQRFLEMCFDPKSPVHAKLKQTLLQMLKETKNES